MKTNNKNLVLLLLSVVFIHFSCSDFLDVVPDNTATVDHAFRKRVEAEAFMYGIYGFLPSFGHPGNNPAFLAGEETWLQPLFTAFNISAWKIANGEQGTQWPLMNFWAAETSATALNGGLPLFTAISDCNVFLENIHKTVDLDEWDRIEWIAEVKFLKAFFHFWLLQMYGPIPIIDNNLSVGSTTMEASYYREPVDKVVKYIVDLIDEISDDLPLVIADRQNLGRITNPIALAVKAKVLTFAASPLFNNDDANDHYKTIVGRCGRRLFPQSYDPQKWVIAVEAIKEAIDACHKAGHALNDFTAESGQLGLDYQTLLSLQAKVAATDRWNPEIVWGATSDVTAIQRFGSPAFSHWQTYGAVSRSWAPTLTTVKQFYTKNGVPIEEDKIWNDVSNPIDLYGLRVGDEAHKFYIEAGYKTINLHFDREPRFYGAIAFDGGLIYGMGSNSDKTMRTTKFYYTSVDFQLQAHSVTGYLAKKMVNRHSSVGVSDAGSSMVRYAFPVIRLADLYLLYAEVQNEIKVAPDAEIYHYIDLIRQRSGLEGVVNSWAKYSNNPTKPSTQAGMREIIHRERMIELAFEGQRYWDLRRWKLLKEYMNKPIQGWDIYGKDISTDAGGFYNLQTIAEPVFEDKDYLWPLHVGVLVRNKNLIQNPGWK